MTISRYGKWFVGTALAVGCATGAYAAALTVSDLQNNKSTNQFITIDLDSEGTITKGNSVRTLTFALGAGDDRAELRRKEQNSGARTIGGNLKVNNFLGNKISVIQGLNVSTIGQTSGGATPIAQLAIRKVSGSTNQYEFYIVQDGGQPTCTALGRLTVGTLKPISVTYDKGKAPVFRSGSASCTTTDTGDAKIGDGGRYYYGKLGAYHTSSGDGASNVTWSAVTDGDAN